jgi:CRISPR-associated protein Csd1
MTAALGGTDPNLPRELLRTAFLGARPPASLAARAGQRLNHLIAHERSLRERQRSRKRDQAPVFAEHWGHALAGAIKLGRFYGTEEAIRMSQVDDLQRRPAYLAGRLYALLEAAEKRHYRTQNGNWPETTGVVRAYGGAASAPRATVGALLANATTAYLPKAGGRLARRVEDAMADLAEAGGLPTSLTVAGQADFGLGFYQQRAELRGGSGTGTGTAADEGGDAGDGLASDEEGEAE